MATPVQIGEREGWQCFRCGQPTRSRSHSSHHRMRRRDGGNGYPNQVHLCGDGTTGCHGWITAHPAKARDGGWIILANTSPPRDPATVGVRHWLYGLVRLTTDGMYDTTIQGEEVTG